MRFGAGCVVGAQCCSRLCGSVYPGVQRVALPRQRSDQEQWAARLFGVVPRGLTEESRGSCAVGSPFALL
eukprot:3231473-Alexandrium_andersonii.AAC.1